MSAIFLECNDEYLSDLLAGLIHSGQKVDYIFTIKPELYLKKAFGDSKIVDEYLFKLPEKINKLNIDNPESLSSEDIIDNLELEKLFLTITDRLCFYPKSVRFRQEIYYQLLLYWKHFLKTNKVNVIFFPRVPHLGYGNIVYHLAKKMGIQTIIVRDTLLDSRTIISQDYMVQEKVPLTFRKSASLMELNRQLDPKLSLNLKTKSSVMNLNISDNSSVLRQNKHGLWSVFHLRTIRALLSMIHPFWEQYYPSIFYLEKHRSWLNYYISLIFYYFHNRKNWAIYRSLSSRVDLKKKYIYLALHYQPERSSMPEGGVFENQLLMVDILSKSLPKGWSLYVKEHPYQFSRSDNRKMNFRDEDFYRKIAGYKNVRLVNIEQPSAELIEKSLAVATLTGSTGWEALLKSKPVITFTPSVWYYPCRSCLLVLSQADGEKTMAILSKLNKLEVKKDLLKFLIFSDKKFIPSITEDFAVRYSELSRNELVGNLVNALMPFFAKARANT